MASSNQETMGFRFPMFFLMNSNKTNVYIYSRNLGGAVLGY